MTVFFLNNTTLWPRLTVAACLFLLCCGDCSADDTSKNPRPSEKDLPKTLSYHQPTGLPEDVAETGKEDTDRPLFAHFAWQSFIALNWPADINARNSPQVEKALGAPSQRVVWETWKSIYELYPESSQGPLPTDWNDFSGATSLSVPAPNLAIKQLPYAKDSINAGKAKLLRTLTRFPTTAIGGLFDFPLIDINHNFVRYETRVNQSAYNHVFLNKFYLDQQLRAADPKATAFPIGSINVKAAWKELSAAELKSGRFYSVKASALTDIGSGEVGLTEIDAGLIGLHIVTKTSKQDNWIWSTFEHIDNLHGEHHGADLPASFLSANLSANMANVNKATLSRALTSNGSFPDYAQRVPALIARIEPINKDIAKINDQYRSHSQISNTVWKNYRLIGVQWPIHNGRIDATQDGARVFEKFQPKELANVTLETFAQRGSCLNCHLSARQPYCDDLIFHLKEKPLFVVRPSANSANRAETPKSQSP